MPFSLNHHYLINMGSFQMLHHMKFSCIIHRQEKIDSLSSKLNYIKTKVIYRVFHDLWTLLQEVISSGFVIKKVHINMCPILDSYGVMTARKLRIEGKDY